MKTTDDIELIKWVYRWDGKTAYSTAFRELFNRYYYEN